MYYTTLLSQEKLYTTEEKLSVIEDISFQGLLKFVPELFSHMYVQGLVHGNMDVNVDMH